METPSPQPALGEFALDPSPNGGMREPVAAAVAVPAPSPATTISPRSHHSGYTASALLSPSVNPLGGTAPRASHAIRPEEDEDVDPPTERGRGFLGRLSIAEWLLKYRGYLLRQIESGRELEVILIDLLIVAALPTAFYGLVTGMATGSWARMLTNPFKLPVLLVLTTVLCLPTLYIFLSYLGSRRSFPQITALAFTGIAIVGIILAAFAPITWFLTFTAPGAYALHVVVNVAVLALAGCMGVRFLFHGVRRVLGNQPGAGKQMTFMTAWMAMYGLVGAQMGWMLRPFFSPTTELFRAPESGGETVFAAIASLVWQLVGGR